MDILFHFHSTSRHTKNKSQRLSSFRSIIKSSTYNPNRRWENDVYAFNEREETDSEARWKAKDEEKKFLNLGNELRRVFRAFDDECH